MKSFILILSFFFIVGCHYESNDGREFEAYINAGLTLIEEGSSSNVEAKIYSVELVEEGVFP